MSRQASTAADDRLVVGTRYCRCTACGEYFGGASTFDEHRAGPMSERRCLSAEEMAERGLERDARGYWRRPLTAAQRAALPA